MSRGGQLVFDLGHRAALGRDDFLVAENNAEAVAWIDRWPDWPSAALVIHGPRGCGKTHLAHVFESASGAVVAHLPTIDPIGPAAPARAARAVIVEDADDWNGGDVAGREETLLHLYNVLAETGRHLLLTARKPPARWRIGLADLRSRLIAAPAVAVTPPAEALIAAVLVKMFADRQLRVGREVIPYLLDRIERSFAAAGEVVAAIDSAALIRRRNITVPLVREVLEGLGPRVLEP